MIHSIFSACLLNPCSSPVFRVFRTRRQKSPDIPEISSQEETCQTLASKPTANKHRHLMVSCRQHLPISSRVWTFPPLFHHHAVFIHLWRQPASSEPFSHMWLLSQLQSNGVARRTEAFQKGGKAVFGPNKRSRTADGSSLFGKKNNQWVFFPFSVKLCGTVQVLVLTSLRMVPSSSLSAESYLEETRGRIQPVIDGFICFKKVDVSSSWGRSGGTSCLFIGSCKNVVTCSQHAKVHHHPLQQRQTWGGFWVNARFNI